LTDLNVLVDDYDLCFILIFAIYTEL